MLEIGFENTYFQVFQGFPALKETRAHIQPNGQFWTIFGQNGQNGFFFKKAFGTFFSLLKALINCKVSEKSNEGIPRKCEKPPFLGILGQNDQFWTVFGQNGRNGIFFQKSAWTIFSAFLSSNKLPSFRKK